MDQVEQQASNQMAALRDPWLFVAWEQASATVYVLALKQHLLALKPHLEAGKAAMDARAEGGRAKARNNGAPPWHAAVVRAARMLQDLGEPDRDLVRLLKQRFNYSDDTIRRVLQKDGVLPPKKNRAC